MFNSVRIALVCDTKSISHSISDLAAGSTAASGAGHFDDQLIRPLVAVSWHRVPQFLRYERHQRVEHDQDLVERPGGDGAGFVLLPSRLREGLGVGL